MPQATPTTAQERFLSLLKRDILKLDLAELDFGIYRGTSQALAFVEPKGLRHQWPQDKFDLLKNIVPSWKFSVPVRGYVLSSNTEAELRIIRPGFSWAAESSVLVHQDVDGAYVERILKNLLLLLPAES